MIPTEEESEEHPDKHNPHEIIMNTINTVFIIPHPTQNDWSIHSYNLIIKDYPIYIPMTLCLVYCALSPIPVIFPSASYSSTPAFHFRRLRRSTPSLPCSGSSNTACRWSHGTAGHSRSDHSLLWCNILQYCILPEQFPIVGVTTLASKLVLPFTHRSRIRNTQSCSYPLCQASFPSVHKYFTVKRILLHYRCIKNPIWHLDTFLTPSFPLPPVELSFYPFCSLGWYLNIEWTSLSFSIVTCKRFTVIIVSFLHFGQNSGKWAYSVSKRIRSMLYSHIVDKEIIDCLLFAGAVVAHKCSFPSEFVE